MARAAYVHMNGPQDEVSGPSEADIATMASAIERVTEGRSNIFRGISENNEPYSFFVDL
jgi:hypothetical protein